jgi:hypothetical protein
MEPSPTAPLFRTLQGASNLTPQERAHLCHMLENSIRADGTLNTNALHAAVQRDATLSSQAKQRFARIVNRYQPGAVRQLAAEQPPRQQRFRIPQVGQLILFLIVIYALAGLASLVIGDTVRDRSITLHDAITRTHTTVPTP